MNWINQYSAYDRVPTYTATTTWSGWSTLNQKCLTCRHFFVKASAPVCECASRTVSHTEHGIKCLSYKKVDE